MNFMRVRHWLVARWHYLQGRVYRYQANRFGDPDGYLRAMDAFTKALAADPHFAQVYLDRGILWWRELDHPRKAIYDLTQAEALDPALVEARFNRGVAHQQLREYEAAIADFRAYLKMGTHPHWRDYAEKMIQELQEWPTQECSH